MRMSDHDKVPTQDSLRGKCKEFAEAAVADNPTLRLVRGWYVDPVWGWREHWWTEHPDGTIHDPTSSQFPLGGVPEWYEEFQGVYPCAECGTEVPEADLVCGACCSGECYGRMVGVPFTPSRSGSTGGTL